MFKKNSFFFVLLFTLIFTISCSSSNDDQVEVDIEAGDDDVDRASLATNGCFNVVIFNNHAYAACGGEIEIISLTTLERNLLSIAADDITIDPDAELLFIQSRTQLQVLSLDDPMQPVIETTVNTNFSIFSGISAANGVLVVSAGSGGSNTQVYNYTNNASSFSLATNGIPIVDNVTGNPDVHVASTNNGVTAFYSQDIGAVANWAIQIVNIDSNGQVIDTPPSIVLTPGQFTGGFAPFGNANFPVESEFLNNRLYVAHFAVQGIEIIDLNTNSLLSEIALPYEPTNIGTDGTSLFVIGATNDAVDIIDPSSATINQSIGDGLQIPTGVAASDTHIAVADRVDGLIVITTR